MTAMQEIVCISATFGDLKVINETLKSKLTSVSQEYLDAGLAVGVHNNMPFSFQLSFNQ